MEYTNRKLGYLSFISTLDIGRYKIRANRKRGIEYETFGGNTLYSVDKHSRNSILPYTAPLRKCFEFEEQEKTPKNWEIDEDFKFCEKCTQTEREDICEAESVRAEYQLMREDLNEIKSQVNELNDIVGKIKKELDADKYLKST